MAAIVPVNWPRLKALPAWTPLSEVSTSAAHLGGVLYKLAPSTYVTCVPYNRQLEDVEGGLFVTMILWAETDGAAKRTQLMEIEADQDANVNPPAEMLLPGQPTTYSEILREVKRGQYGEFREWVDYRVAKDGAFVQQTLNVPPLSFHFRKNDEDHRQRCYAIQYRLS